MRKPRILVVDDEPVQRESIAVWLIEDGYEVETAGSGAEAVGLVERGEYDLYFVDLKMPPGMDGIETMRAIRTLQDDAAVVIITAYATVDTAVQAIKEGAQEYVVKPCNPKELSLIIERILRVRNLQRENRILRERIAREYAFHDLVSKNATMHEIFELVENVGVLRTTVLIQGESGTGKEMIARAIHACSDRRNRPFVPVPCTALAESLLESELFGHERGAFTGAVERRLGKFEQANGGTIFLDEIGDMSPKLQAELLRVLQERRFCRVGANREIEVDVRVVAATNVDLQAAVQEGRFRDDLFYRLNVVTIRVPPLRERAEDIPLLARAFLERVGAEIGKQVEDIDEEALALLQAHAWPGNVRELRNAVERAMVVARGKVLGAREFAFLTSSNGGDAEWSPPPDLPLRDLERLAIEAALERTHGNVKAAAESLGIDRSTLYDKIKRYAISRPG